MIQKYMIIKMYIGDIPNSEVGQWCRQTLDLLKDSHYTKQYLIPTRVEESSIEFMTIDTKTGLVSSSIQNSNIIPEDYKEMIEILERINDSIKGNKDEDNK